MRKVLLVCLFAAPSLFAAAPVISPGGVVNGASFLPQPDPLAPGSIVSIFGTALAPSVAAAPSLPLSTRLNGTTVNFGGKPAPLFFVSPNQINAQVPFDVSTGTVSVNVTTAEGASASVTVGIQAQAPALFTASSTGYGPAAAQHADGSPVDAARPPRAGETVILYGTGFGAVRDSIASGAPATAANPTLGQVRATIGGKAARVDYAGLAPGFVGLYQINVVVPDGVLPGDPLILNQTVLNASGQPAGQVAASPTLLGLVPAGGLTRFLPFPQGTQVLGNPNFLPGDAFLAFEGRDACVKTVAFFQYHDRTAGVARGLPDGVSCIARQVELQVAAAVGGQAPAARLLAPTFSADATPALANGFLSLDPATGNTTVLTLPDTLSADRFDANFFAALGATNVAPGRKADGSPGAGMLLMDARNQMRTILNPAGDRAQFYGGQMLLDAQNNILYSGAGRAAAGPFTEIVALNLRTNAAEAVLPPPGLTSANAGRLQLDPRRRLLVSLTRDGDTSPAYNFRVYDLAGGTATATALPSGLTPALSGANNNIPVFFYVPADNVAYVPVVSSSNPQLVTGIVVVDLTRGIAGTTPLPSGVKDLSGVTEAGGDLYGLMNSDSSGGAEGLLVFNPVDGTSTVFKLPSGVAAIGRGQAGKSATAGQVRAYARVAERNLVLAPGSKSDPTVSDAGLVVFDQASGAARLIPLPAGVARLHSTGNLFMKAATNKAFMMGETGAPGAADVLVWFDLGTGSSGTLAVPSPATQIQNVFESPATGMAVATANTRGYAVWQLP